MKKLLFIQVILLFGLSNAFSQQDSIIFKNGNYIVGEVKTMDRNVLNH